MEKGARGNTRSNGEKKRSYRSPRTLRPRSGRPVLGRDLLLDSPATEKMIVSVLFELLRVETFKLPTIVNVIENNVVTKVSSSIDYNIFIYIFVEEILYTYNII